jgi:large subunit ribosomal protein L30
MALKLKVTQVKSSIGLPPDQRSTLKGLGLSRPGRSRVLNDTPQVRGMIRKVQHLIRVAPVE